MGILVKEITPTIEDIDMNLKMNNRGFLRIFQEVANQASSEVGFGITNIEKTNVTWVILYWRLEIFKRVNYEDTLTVKTWANFSKKIYSTRYFEMYLGDELVAKADSKWVLVNTKSHAITKIPDEMLEAYGTVDTKLYDNELKIKLTLPEEYDTSFTYHTMKRDLDANHHVNNISFYDIASEIIPQDLLNSTKEINIIYKKEIPYGEKIECIYKDNTVYLYNKEKDILHGAIIIK